MSMKRLIVVVLFLLMACSGDRSVIKLERYDGGFFQVDIPRGWQVMTGGECSTFGLVIRDRQRPTNQVFYFGSVGPLYLSVQQKKIDMGYMQMGGYPVTWIEMPVVSPFTPENFFSHFHEMTKTSIAQNYMSGLPQLYDLRVISSMDYPSQFPGGKKALVRVLFTEGEQIGEGLLMCTTVPILLFTGGPGGGIGYAYMVAGITAEKSQFVRLQPELLKSLESFTISEQYVNKCMQKSQEQFRGILKAGQTLSETSDLIQKGWQNRNERYDVMSEKQSDAILGYERIYNPETNQTYQVTHEFWENYRQNQEQFDMSGLQVIPNTNYELWMQAPELQRDIR